MKLFLKKALSDSDIIIILFNNNHLKITRVDVFPLILYDIYLCQDFFIDMYFISLLKRHMYVIKFVRYIVQKFKQDIYIMFSCVICYITYDHS